MVSGWALIDWALMDGTACDSAGVKDVGTNSRAEARIIPIGFASTYDDAADVDSDGG